MHNNITIDSHCLGAQPSVIKNHGSNYPQMKGNLKNATLVVSVILCKTLQWEEN